MTEERKRSLHLRCRRTVSRSGSRPSSHRALKRALAAFLLGSAVLLAGHAASAGSVTRTPSGREIRWTEDEIVVHPTTALLRDAGERAAAAWNRALSDLAAPRLKIGPLAPAGSVVRPDHKSLLSMQHQRWCPAGVAEHTDCYDRRRNAITHLFPILVPGSPHDGETAEADIEINGVDFDWDEEKLVTVLSHELGHVLGLDHSCGIVPNSGTAPVACTQPVARGSIMYPDPLEPGREPVLVPSADDLATLKTLYPAKPRRGCDGCAATAHSPACGLRILALLLAAVAVRIAWRRAINAHRERCRAREPRTPICLTGKFDVDDRAGN